MLLWLLTKIHFIGGVFGALLLCLLLCLCIALVIVAIIIRRSRRPYRRLDKVWLIDWKDLEVDQQIGAGARGPVEHGNPILRRTHIAYPPTATWKGVEVAVKMLGAKLTGEDNKEVVTDIPITKQLQSQFVNEAALLTTLRHPVLIPLRSNNIH